MTEIPTTTPPSTESRLVEIANIMRGVESPGTHMSKSDKLSYGMGLTGGMALAIQLSEDGRDDPHRSWLLDCLKALDRITALITEVGEGQ